MRELKDPLPEAKLFGAFTAEFNRNPKTEEEFAVYIQRDARELAESIREKYYVLNLKAKAFSSESVVAYEELKERGWHQTARGDSSVSLVSPEDLIKLLNP